MVQKFYSVVLLTPPLHREEQQIQPKRKQGKDAKRILIGPRTRRKYWKAEVARGKGDWLAFECIA
jgi:hypothetical protein